MPPRNFSFRFSCASRVEAHCFLCVSIVARNRYVQRAEPCVVRVLCGVQAAARGHTQGPGTREEGRTNPCPACAREYLVCALWSLLAGSRPRGASLAVCAAVSLSLRSVSSVSSTRPYPSCPNVSSKAVPSPTILPTTTVVLQYRILYSTELPDKRPPNT